MKLNLGCGSKILKDYVNVDINYGLKKNYLEMLKKGEIDQAQLQSYIDKYNNVIKEMRIRWMVIKD